MDESQDYYEEDSQTQQSGTGLRRQLENTLKENRELRRETEYFRAEKLVATVASSLEEAGFQGAQAKFVPLDVAQDPARLPGWIQENQGLLARNAAVDEELSGDSDGDSMGAERKSGIRRMQSLSAGGDTATADLEALQQRMLDPNLSEEDFDAMVAQYRA